MIQYYKDTNHISGADKINYFVRYEKGFCETIGC